MARVYVAWHCAHYLSNGERRYTRAQTTDTTANLLKYVHLNNYISLFIITIFFFTAPGRQFSIDNWIHNADLGFTSQVTYRHGRIVVKASGLYYVYSQISFLEVFDVDNRGVAIRNDYLESHSLSHYMYRYNLIYPNGGEEELMQNSITKCWGQNKAFGEYSSYLGAVFYLRKGDEVFVKVSNLTLIVQNPKSNYFGLFKL